MGSNLALNMADKGFSVVAYDPWERASSRFRERLSADESAMIDVADSVDALIAALPVPRTLLIMVKAGDPVDAVITSLRPLLQPGDVVIDGGNSHYRQTIRRERELNAEEILFIGLGISGGEEGARNGPSMMAGGTAEAYEKVRPVLEAIAARFAGEPCCALVGADGAGHFVKMIHNGIEYGVMQCIAESYVLLRDLCGLDHAAMADTFQSWNQSELSSYLIEITANILRRRDEFSDAPLVELILDKAAQKGTGRWSSEAALELGIPTPTITGAVFARMLAALKEERIEAAAVLPKAQILQCGEERPEMIEAIRQALIGAIVVTYAQGLATIRAACREHGWSIDMASVASIWRDGCVIRAQMLDDVMHAYRSDDELKNLLCAPAFAGMLMQANGHWRRVVAIAVQHAMPVPGLSSALAYFDGYRSPRLWANMIQAQRDYFGAHTYERIDRPGDFHTQW
jgi:6-phosphogluconate dehydrogenase